MAVMPVLLNALSLFGDLLVVKSNPPASPAADVARSLKKIYGV